ncbi:MAG: hypothetical protein BroJett038_05420 [Chloroflexota bacterium]|nr:MAG: hypothetical protein BroJett038_05420 [Chloroflexota bacterium]
MSKNLRILVADDQSDVRYALRTLLQLVKELHVEVVGEAADADTLLNEVASLEPDVLLVDWKLPGLRAIAYLRALYPRLRIIVLSVRAEARQAALDAGADAFVFKGDPVERLVEAIQHVRDLHRPPTGE